MAPSRKATKTAINAAAEFDFAAFLGEFEEPTFTRPLMRKGAMLPDLTRRLKVLSDLDKEVERLEAVEDGKERDLTDVSPLAKLKRRRDELTLEYNALAEEYNASAVDFTFRVPNQDDDGERIRELCEERGLVAPERPNVDKFEGMDDEQKAALLKVWEDDFGHWWDQSTLCSMAVTCISHNFTVDQWVALEKKVGIPAFSALRAAWSEAVQAAAPNAPFSLRPLPTQEPEE